MRILVTGANGQLGCELRRLFETGIAEIGAIPSEYAQAEVVYTDSDELDITDAAAVDAFIDEQMFDIIFNCAAYTNVDGCEANEEAAFLVNATGAENLARAAARTGATLVHVSTDYVFPGNVAGERVETDVTSPLSAYGRTKLAGERAVAAACPAHHIVRTAWLYGYVGKNFAKTMLRLAQNHDFVEVVDDQLGNPTSANDLAYELLRIALSDHYGIWHCTNNGTCSWADFAAAVLNGAHTGCEVRRCTSAQYKEKHPESADRPAFSSLKNARLEVTLGDEMRPWQEALTTYLTNLADLQD